MRKFFAIITCFLLLGFSSLFSQVLVNIKIWLEGPYQPGSTMNTLLEDNGLIPLTSPYPDSLIAAAIPDGTVDWIYVELRSQPEYHPISARSFLLQSNGQITDTDGTTVDLTMEGADNGDYYIALSHQNHLAVMSASAVPLNSATTTVYDFTTGTEKFYGGDAALCETDHYGMYSGDTNVSGIITNADKDSIISYLNSAVYHCADANRSGIVTNADKDPIIQNLNKATEVESPTVLMDIDGNTYQTVTIGNQIWMAENLKVTHYRNGDPIPHVTDNLTWTTLTTGAYCAYNNSEVIAAERGYLYNWFAVVDSRSIAPPGWHVPSDDDWKTLEMAIGMSQAQADGMEWRGTDEGGKLKEIGTVHWYGPNTGATDEFGFSGISGGCRLRTDGDFYWIGWDARYWTSTEGTETWFAWFRLLNTLHADMRRTQHDKERGFSIRLVKD